MLGKRGDEIQSKINGAFHQLFYGDDSTQRVYYPVGADLGYIKDINNNDIRTEGMSYGMMIAVQLDKKEVFDRLWKWAKTFMQHHQGPRKNYFAWHCRTDGSKISSTAASDGEEWFVTALFFASARWGNGEGIFHYRNEAQAILDAMLTQESQPEHDDTSTNMFNAKEQQVVFVPEIQGAGFTDPSYHLPHFYELWALWATKENRFWAEAAATSRQFLKKAAHPVTGLAPDYARFDGTPFSPWGGGHQYFQFDAWRVAMNVAVDYSWFAKDNWEVSQSNRILRFFYSKGIGVHGNVYTLEGEQLSSDHSTGLVAMNAVAALAATIPERKEFVEELWNAAIPSGHYRYYDGMLYLLAFLHVSGSYKILSPPQ
ncbi:MAG: glycosyl hydrolase family 8 [bacterium]